MGLLTLLVGATHAHLAWSVSVNEARGIRPAMALNQVDEEEPDLRTQERVARNDALFREANEGIEHAATKYEVLDQVPFICECADENCRKLLVLSVNEYEEIRQDPRHFLNAPGHVHADQGAAQVVTDRGRYIIVAKTGHAGDVAEQLDPRGGGA